jgi:hypothetical protein
LVCSEVLALTGSEGTSSPVAREIAGRFWPGLDPMLGMALAGVAVALVTSLGFSRRRSAKPCMRCGNPVCRRCDKDLGRNDRQCVQCRNVFSSTSKVPAQGRVGKQLEIRRYQGRMQRVAWLLSVLVSGAGQLFLGLLGGGVYLFLFLFAVIQILFRHGMLRVPYGPAPWWLKTAPAAILLVWIYARSLRGLHRHSTEPGHGA